MFFAKKLFFQEQLKFDERLFQTTGWQDIKLPEGTYEVQSHGAGGNNGGNGGTGPGGTGSGPGGAGGAGGAGEHKVVTMVLFAPTTVSVYVGATGYAAGGAGGPNNSAYAAAGGAGGAGGAPSLICFPKERGLIEDGGEETATLRGVSANGGGGGGGGGGGAAAYVYTRSGGGGGGGGGGYAWVKWDAAEELPVFVTVEGKNGGLGNYNGNGGSGVSGSTDLFPGVYSGGGNSSSAGNAGGSGATGGGASAGGGGGSPANANTISGGGGGGGAPGSASAHGGFGGYGRSGASASRQGGNGYNASTTKDSTVDYKGNTVTDGWGTAGSNGWVYIKKIATPLPILQEYASPYSVTAPLDQAQYLSMPPGNYYVGIKSTNGGPLVELNTKLVTTQTWSVHFESGENAYIALESGANPRILWQSSGASTATTDGFVKIIQLADITSTQDFGLVNEAATSTRDWGDITETVTATENWGAIIK